MKLPDRLVRPADPSRSAPGATVPRRRPPSHGTSLRARSVKSHIRSQSPPLPATAGEARPRKSQLGPLPGSITCSSRSPGDVSGWSRRLRCRAESGPCCGCSPPRCAAIPPSPWPPWDGGYPHSAPQPRRVRGGSPAMRQDPAPGVAVGPGLTVVRARWDVGCGAGSPGVEGPAGVRTESNWPGCEPRSKAARAAWGWREGQRWTLARVITLIGRLFHVRYTLRGTSYLLHRMGYSPQVPVHRAAEGDDKAITAWRTGTWADSPRVGKHQAGQPPARGNSASTQHAVRHRLGDDLKQCAS
jgi:Winged helix-turn helix